MGNNYQQPVDRGEQCIVVLVRTRVPGIHNISYIVQLIVCRFNVLTQTCHKMLWRSHLGHAAVPLAASVVLLRLNNMAKLGYLTAVENHSSAMPQSFDIDSACRSLLSPLTKSDIYMLDLAILWPDWNMFDPSIHILPNSPNILTLPSASWVIKRKPVLISCNTSQDNEHTWIPVTSYGELSCINWHIQRTIWIQIGHLSDMVSWMSCLQPSGMHWHLKIQSRIQHSGRLEGSQSQLVSQDSS